MGNSININPFAEANIIKNPNVINLNYTNQDFSSMKTRLVSFMNERFGVNGTVLPNTFNDLVEGSIAIMLTENFAFLADTLSFKMDQQFLEMWVDSITEIENMFRLCKITGFQPQPPIAARSLWTATTNNPISGDIVIPTPVSLSVTSNDTPINIELFAADANNNPIFDEDIIIPAGQSFNQSIVGLEGRTISEQQFTGTGDVGQVVQLTTSPVIFGSIRVSVDGVEWDMVDYFTDSQPRREFRVEYTSDYTAFIIFGNNRAGMIPSRGSRIFVTYRVGGGTVGNIVTGFVDLQVQASVPGLLFNVPVTFRNYTRGENGYDGDTLEEIRRKLPLWNRTQNRAVTGGDYKTLTDQYATAYHGQIGKSNVILRNHGCAGNVIDIYILARDGNNLIEASTELKADLKNYLYGVQMMTDYICIKDGTVISSDVQIDVRLDRFYRKFEDEIKAKISRRLDTFFLLSNWEFGTTLRDIDIIKELSDIKEIQSFDINFVTNNQENSGNMVVANYYEIIRPDNISITFNYS